MKLKVFSIYDNKAEVYLTPFFQKTVGEAERSFQTLATDSKSTINQYPSDYSLHLIGTYDDNDGSLDPVFPPQHIAQALSLMTRSN